MNIYVLETPGGERSVPIIDSLQECNSFTLKPINSIMVSNLGDVPELFKSQFLARYGREVLPGEYGCLQSHRLAWKAIALSEKPGIVFEDDAREIDCKRLWHFACLFLSKNGEGKTILSFHDPRLPRKRQILKSDSFFQLYGYSSHAVAYLITPSAALELISRSDNLASVADWPESSVKYFLSPWQVSHGDESSSSMISELGPRANLGGGFKLSNLVTLRHYFENKYYFGGLLKYARLVIFPVIRIKLDTWRLKLIALDIYDYSRRQN